MTRKDKMTATRRFMQEFNLGRDAADAIITGSRLVVTLHDTSAVPIDSRCETWNGLPVQWNVPARVLTVDWRAPS